MLYKCFVILFILISLNSYGQEYDNSNYDLKYIRLEIEVNPEVFYIKGVITSYFEIIKSSSIIIFELTNELTVDSIVFHQNKTNFSHSDNHLILNFEQNFEADDFDSVSVYYQGIPPKENSRAFETSLHENIPIMWTLSEPYGAKDWFPCKQTLNDKIDSIDMYIIAPDLYLVAGNGILISEENINGNRITHWKHKYPIATYLIGFAITNYVRYSDYAILSDGDSLEILNYVYPEDLVYSQINTPNVIDVLEFFDSLFIPYPFERYGHAQFEWGGGMEHQTMSFMVNFSHKLMAHELAHQWFGDFITCQSWQDIWINESFATYLEGLTAEMGLADYSWDYWKSINLFEATQSEFGSVYIYDTTSHATIFKHNLVYAKGAMVLNTLRWQLGDSIFFQSIREFLNDKNLTYGFAKTEDIKQHFEKTSGLDLTEFFDDWIYGEGYPEYKIYWSQNKANQVKVIINQYQTNASVNFFELKVPILFTGFNSDSLVVLENNFNMQEFEFNLDFKIIKAEFDPEKNILTKGSEINQFFSSEENFSFSVIPNPACVNIDIMFPSNIYIKKIEILDLVGKVICLEELNRVVNIYKIDTSWIETGIYIVKIELKNQILQKRILILHKI
jgi:aminopeptidase N